MMVSFFKALLSGTQCSVYSPRSGASRKPRLRHWFVSFRGAEGDEESAVPWWCHSEQAKATRNLLFLIRLAAGVSLDVLGRGRHNRLPVKRSTNQLFTRGNHDAEIRPPVRSLGFSDSPDDADESAPGARRRPALRGESRARRRGEDARRHGAPRRRLPARRARQVPRAASAYALQQVGRA